MKEDASPFGCDCLRDQIHLFELADNWMRIKICLRCVDFSFHGENNHNEIQDFLCEEQLKCTNITAGPCCKQPISLV